MAHPVGKRFPKGNPSKTVYPIETGSAVDSFGRKRVSNPAPVWEHKNVSDRGSTVMDEYMVGMIIEHGTVTGGPFQVGDIITGDTSLYDATVTAVNVGSITVSSCFPDFDIATPDNILGSLSGATADITTINTGSYVSHNVGESTVSLTIGAGATDKVVRQPTRYLAYVPGKGQFIKMTFACDITGSMRFVRRDSTGGSVKTVSIEQADWNEDKFDGSEDTKNASEVTLDPTKRGILAIDFEWLAAGQVRFGFDFEGEVRIAHEEHHANEEIIYDDTTSDNGNRPYMRSGSLPIRYEIVKDGASTFYRIGYFDDEDGLYFEVEDTTGTGTILKEFCHTVESEGGYLLPGLETTVGNGAIKRTGITTTRIPLFAIRAKTALFNGLINRKILKLLRSKFFATGVDIYFEVTHNHHPNGYTANWSNLSPTSGFEYSTDITTAVGRPEHRIDDDNVSASGGSRGGGSSTTDQTQNLHGFIANDILGTNGQAFIVWGTAHSGTGQASVSLTVVEFD